MKRLLLIFLTGICFGSMAQKGAFKLGFRLAPSSNLATIKDKDATPSDIRYVADGYTIKHSNAAGVGFSFFIDYFFSDHVAFSTGLWFTQKNFNVTNYDGSTNFRNNPNNYYYGPNYGYYYANNYGYAYTGTSFYKSTYMQLPLLFKFLSNELFTNFRLYGTFGPTIDFRMGEKVDGPDYAHYWNMAQNNAQWANRDRNATGRPVKLFNPVDFTLYLSAGVNYEIVDKLEVFGGIMFNKGFVNAINPKLRFGEPSQTKVNTDVSFKSNLLGAELGITYKLK